MPDSGFYARHFSAPRRERAGRKSIDAVMIFGGVLTMGVAGRGALAELGLLPEFIATRVRDEERDRAAARDRR